MGGDLKARQAELVEQLKSMVKPWIERAHTIRHADDRLPQGGNGK